jgi:hypothetical protein
MSDFKTEFFNLEAMRNTVMARLGDYLQLPQKIDNMNAVVAKMTSASAADFKIVLPSLKTRVNAQIVAAMALKDKLFAFTDKVQANPELKKVITGDVGILEFAVTSLFGKKTDINQYKDYLTEALDLSKKSAALIKTMEMLKAEIENVQSAITNNVKLHPLEEPVAEPKTWQTKGAMILGGLVLAGLAVHSAYKSRKAASN